MICPSCQSANPEWAKFCCRCGRLLPKKPRKILKTLLIIFFVFFLLSGAMLVSFFVGLGFGTASQTKISRLETQVLQGEGEEKIAVLYLDGIIVEKESPTSFGQVTKDVISSRKFSKLLKDIANEEEVKAVILRINSPGGSVQATQEIFEAILDFKQKTGKKVIASLADLAASGGYYLAAAADKIIASPTTITGSIGVIIEFLNVSELGEKVGVKEEVIKSGPYKDILSPFRGITDEERGILQKIVDEAYNQFIKAIVSSRSLPRNKVAEIADGRILSGKEAQSIGLADVLGGFQDSIKLAKTEAGLAEATIIEVGKPSFWEMILGSFVQKLNPLSSLGEINLNIGTDCKLGPAYLYKPGVF